MTVADGERGFRVVQRTLMRADQELDVRALYMGGVTGLGGGEGISRQSGSDAFEEVDEGSSAEGVGSMAGFGEVDETGALAIEAGRRVTFGTYFNAFPASYWRRWTDFGSVRLQLRVDGPGNVVVYRSTSKGHVVRADSKVVAGAGPHEVEFELTLAPFIDGGWYWFDVEAGHAPLTVREATWGVETDRLDESRVTIGITTFNRPEFCVDQLLNLGQDQDVLAMLDEVLVVDQGSQKVRDHEKYAEAAARLGKKLRVIDQPNLGGSGGFSRAMDEALTVGLSDYVLLLDDDVVCELEGIRRAVAFGDLAKQRVVVGGQMFSLYDRSVMHAFGEAIKRYTWFWGPAPGTTHGHDFSKKSLRSTPWLHRRVDVDYNGWWMCLIPTDVIREIGLSLPMFIKWDDAEFGLRAGAAGYPTVTLPGVAVWHVPWTEKDDTLDWQAYFHERNRLVSALLHSPYERGGRLPLESLENHVKRLVSMQYSTGEIILMALSDVLEGPERMHRDIAERMAEVRALRANYTDGVAKTSLDEFPPPRLKRPPRRGKGVPMPSSTVGKAKMAVLGLVRQVLPERDLAEQHPEGIVPHVDQRWWRLAFFDSAVVSSADGVAASWYRRDRTQFTDQLTRSLQLHRRLHQEWPELSQRYREGLAELTSPQEWRETFAGRQES